MFHGTKEEVWSEHGEVVKLVEVVAIIPPPVMHAHPGHLWTRGLSCNQTCLFLASPHSPAPGGHVSLVQRAASPEMISLLHLTSKMSGLFEILGKIPQTEI